MNQAAKVEPPDFSSQQSIEGHENQALYDRVAEVLAHTSWTLARNCVDPFEVVGGIGWSGWTALRRYHVRLLPERMVWTKTGIAQATLGRKTARAKLTHTQSLSCSRHGTKTSSSLGRESHPIRTNELDMVTWTPTLELA